MASLLSSLSFEEDSTMLTVLMPGRLDVLKVLHQIGPVSVRALASRMKREYKNVHHDLQVLERAGLVKRSADGTLIAPLKIIIAEIALAAQQSRLVPAAGTWIVSIWIIYSDSCSAGS